MSAATKDAVQLETSKRPEPQWLSKWSLRARLVVVLLAVLTLALTVASIAAVWVLQKQLMESVDGELRAASGNIHPRKLEAAAFRSENWDPHDLYKGRYYVEVRGVDGQFLPVDASLVDDAASGVSWNTAATQIPDLDAIFSTPEVRGSFVKSGREGRAITVDQPVVAEEGGSTGETKQWRVLVKPVNLRLLEHGASAPQESDNFVTVPALLAVAVDLEPTHSTVRKVAQGLALLSAGVLLAAAALGVAALRGALAPLREIEQVAEAVTAGDRTKRVPVRPETTEVGRLGGTLNSMLDQLDTTLKEREASEARMRQFVGDASHELRTPLASVRGFAELYRHGALPDQDAVGGAFGRIEHEAKRMGGLVEDLLLLARLDEQRPLAVESVDLCVLGGDLVHDATSLAPDRTVRLQGLNGGAPQSTLVAGDDARLRQVLTNLMSNAIRYTPEGSSIEVAVGRDGADSVVRVVDHGPGVPAEDADRIFGRFFRADASRQRATGGAGLGLAIVASIVAAHDGQVQVLQTPEGGATFEVRLPASRHVLSDDD